MRIAVWLLGVVVAGSLPLSGSPARPGAGVEPPAQAKSAETPEDVPVRKKIGWFNKPVKTTAAEQLACADSLEKAGESRAAMRAYRALVSKWHESPEAVTAQLKYATLLDKGGWYEDAFDEYQYLAHFFAGRFNYEEVLDRQFVMASALTKAGWFRSPDSARKRFLVLSKNASSWSKLPEVFLILGKLSQEKDDTFAALDYYTEVTTRYPAHEAAAEASFRIAMLMADEADDSRRDESACRDALAALAAFMRDHRQDKSVALAQERYKVLKERLASMHFGRAVFYDRTVRKPASALIVYRTFMRSFPSSDLVAEASARIDALEKVVEDSKNEKKSP